MSRSILKGNKTIRLSTRDVEDKYSFEYWKEQICNYVINVDCEKYKSHTPFYGNLNLERYDDIVISEMHSQPSCFIRRSKHIHKINSDFVLLTLRLDSSARKIIDSRSVSVASGDISIYHGTRESRLHVSDNVEALIYQVPLSYISKYIAHPEDLHGAIISSESQLGKLVADYMLSLASQLGQIAPEVRAPVIDNFLQLLSISASGSKRAPDMQLECVQSSMIMQIKDFIVLNIESPELSPEFIANQFRISLRYLYNLFSKEKMTPCQFIIEARLNSAEMQLTHEDFLHKSISEIAYDVGFSNVSHFCKLFKKKNKLTPSDFRENRKR